MVATGQGASAGILVKNAGALERAEKVCVLAVDKTGTLTSGEPVVTDLLALATSANEALALAAALEQGSEHPLAKAILRHAQARDVDLPALEEFRALPGRGVEGRVDGRLLRLAAPGGLPGTALPHESIATLQRAGKTVVVLSEARQGGSAGDVDVALCDIRLPDMRGYDLMMKLKEFMGVVPIILMTGFGYDPGHSIVKARQAGLLPNAVLYKPFRLDQLLTTVETVIDATSDEMTRLAQSS